MKKIEGYEETEVAGQREKLVAGSYVCKILKVEDMPEKEMLKIYYDIAEGKFKDYFKKLGEALGQERGWCVKSYTTKALPFFKAFITAIEKSNKGYVWNWDEKTLADKIVVINFQEEEYIDQKASKWEIKVGLRVGEFRSIEKFRNGDVKVLPRKTLSDADRVSVEEHNASLTISANDVTDEDLPF